VKDSCVDRKEDHVVSESLLTKVSFPYSSTFFLLDHIGDKTRIKSRHIYKESEDHGEN
jgi:hypothetical protein